MKKLHLFSDGPVDDYLPKPDLPQIWQSIYYEGIRGNHILFTREELKEISFTLTSGRFTLEAHDKKLALDTSTKLFTCSNYSLMRPMISRLNIKQKSIFFLLYKRALKRWNKALRDSLN